MSLPKDNILVNMLNMGWIDTGQWDRHDKEMPARNCEPGRIRPDGA